jgi:hypothetical protein
MAYLTINGLNTLQNCVINEKNKFIFQNEKDSYINNTNCHPEEC